MSLQDAQRLANFAKWTGDNKISLREKKTSALWERAKIVFGQGPQTSEQADVYLRRYDVLPNFSRTKLDSLKQLKLLAEKEPTLDKEFALSELAFNEASVADTMGRKEKAKLWYLASVYHAYRYLFSPNFNSHRNAYSPEFRMTVDYYNQSLENLLRILNKEDGLRPNVTRDLNIDGWNVAFQIRLNGPWKAEDFDKIEFANDFEIKGVGNKHRTEGLGVPLIAARKQKHKTVSPAEKYYPTGLAFPITAFLRFSEESCEIGTQNVNNVHCIIEMHDSLSNKNVVVRNRAAPLESDITTPLAYFLQNPLVSTKVLETVGLLDGKLLDNLAGLYMLEPYDPNRVPVVLVHGLWSSPLTWLEMFNELRALPEIREQYQFWFYLYPTGQPFWASASQMRVDLNEVRATVDPNKEFVTLDQMVLVGHSMGGLVSRLQTVDSGDAFWRILSDRPFDELDAESNIKNEIRDVLFFKANPSVKRVVTIGTPHRGSSFANNFTRWLAHRVIRLPDIVSGNRLKQIRNRDEIFKNKEILATKTSIDSLSPGSPFLAELLNRKSAPWVQLHNIVGNVEKRQYFGIAGELKPTNSDGIVATESSTFDTAVSSIEVNARHQDIQSQPKTILEVRRILLEHITDIRQAKAAHQLRLGTNQSQQRDLSRNRAQQAGFHMEELPPAQDSLPQKHNSAQHSSLNPTTTSRQNLSQPSSLQHNQIRPGSAVRRISDGPNEVPVPEFSRN